MPFINPGHPARYWHEEGDVCVCDLCPHRCRIGKGSFGICNSRKNVDGRLTAYSYGRISSMAVDPVEKKPLYHYHPATSVFSVGGIGCNLRCQYCQNYPISMGPFGKKRITYKSPAEIIDLCRRRKFDSIAFTYNEPAIWFEYILDVKEAAPDLDIILVSNGMIDGAPLLDLCKISGAMNIDVKAFNGEFYRQACGGDLEDVKRTCETVFRCRNRVHLELTYLTIPGYNDGEDEVKRFAEWVRGSLSSDVPIHFNRFHPDYNMTAVPMTPVDTLLRCKKIAEDSGIDCCYVGNVLTDNASDTCCPECGATVIKRTGYKVGAINLDGDRCAFCKHRLNIVR